YEILNDGSPGVFQLQAGIVDGSAPRRVVGQTLNYFDGPAFEGLPLSQLGDHGVLSRTERLVLTEGILREAYRGDAAGPELPPCSAPAAPPAGPAEYPQEFRDRRPPLVGYRYRSGDAESGVERGYFAVVQRRRYDCQDAPAARGRGLLLATRSPLGQ